MDAYQACQGNKALLERVADQIYFTNRVKKILGDVGIIYIGQLVTRTPEQLLNIHQLGHESLQNIITVLDGLGLCLGVKCPKDTRLDNEAEIAKFYNIRDDVQPMQNMENIPIDRLAREAELLGLAFSVVMGAPRGSLIGANGANIDLDTFVHGQHPNLTDIFPRYGDFAIDVAMPHRVTEHFSRLGIYRRINGICQYAFREVANERLLFPDDFSMPLSPEALQKAIWRRRYPEKKTIPTDLNPCGRLSILTVFVASSGVKEGICSTELYEIASALSGTTLWPLLEPYLKPREPEN